MSPSASTEEVRAAYRALARRLHPDRLGDVSDAERTLADRRMREINESWEVLRDPARRRAYDESRLLRAPSSPRGAGAPRSGPPTSPVHRASAGDEDLVDVMPPMTALTAGLFRHLPWVVLVVVFSVIFVLTAYAGGKASDAPGDAPQAAVIGSCVDVESGPVTSVVPCDGPHELRIVDRVDESTACPPGSERRRLGDDGLLDCVVAS